MKKWLSVVLALALLIAGLTGSILAEEKQGQREASGIDYLVLVNRKHALPEGWEEAMETVTITNARGKEVTVERTAYAAFLQLKEALAQENVLIDIESAYLSVAEQQETVNRLTEKNGESFVRQYVLKPGYSEYHTGLALNLSLIMNGKNVYKTKDMVLYPDTWAVIHAHLAEYGFILRYPYEKKDVTGFGYEAWHIRYVGAAAAKAMEEQGLALEEYVEMLEQ